MSPKVVVVLALMLAAACGGRADPPRARTTVVDGREVFVIHPPEGECDDTGTASCTAAWTIESSLYAVECSEVPERQRTGELYAVGADDEVPFAEARLLPGIEPFERLAVRQKRSGAPCPHDTGTWVILRHVAIIAEPVGGGARPSRDRPFGHMTAGSGGAAGHQLPGLPRAAGGTDPR